MPHTSTVCPATAFPLESWGFQPTSNNQYPYDVQKFALKKKRNKNLHE